MGALLHVVNPAPRLIYILEGDRDSPNPTTFVFRRLSRAEMFEFRDRGRFDVKKAAKVAQIRKQVKKEGRECTDDEIAVLASFEPQNFEDFKRWCGAAAYAVECGLEEINNLTDDHGESLKIQPAEFVKSVPLKTLGELVKFLISMSVHADDGAVPEQAAVGRQDREQG